MGWLAQPIKALPCLVSLMMDSIWGMHRKLEGEKNSTELSSDATCAKVPGTTTYDDKMK